MGTTVAFQVYAFQEDAFQTYETIYEVDGSIVKFVRVYCRKADNSHSFRQLMDTTAARYTPNLLITKQVTNTVFVTKRPSSVDVMR